MLGSANMDAFIVVMIALTAKGVDPFLFGLFTNIGLGVGAAIVLATVYRNVWTWQTIKTRTFRDHIRHKYFAFSVLGRLEYAFFFLATTHIGIVQTTVLWGLHPLLYVLVLDSSTKTTNREARYRKFTMRDVTLLLFAFVGFAFTVMSQPSPSVDRNLVLGVLLAVPACVCAAVNAYNIVWGMRLANALDSHLDRPKLEAACCMAGTVGAAITTFPLLLLFATGAGGDFQLTSTGFSGAVLIGLVLYAPSIALVRVANIRTRNLGVNAIGYLTPALTLVYLRLFGQVGDVRLSYITVGVVLIVTANLLLNKSAVNARAAVTHPSAPTK